MSGRWIGLLLLLSPAPPLGDAPAFAKAAAGGRGKQDGDLEKFKPLIRACLWASKAADRANALRELEDLKYGDRALTRAEFNAVEKLVRDGREYAEADPAQEHVLTAAARPGRELRVLVTLPESYTPKRSFPLLVAMGGGPVPSKALARDQARYMTSLWKRLTKKTGWVLAAVEDSVSLSTDGPDLRYELLRPADFRAAVDAVQERFSVNPIRVYATGISLGANYAIQFAAAHPDWFAGIFPVVSEGESREHVLRNLSNISVYAINGAKDKNIRTIEGPRKLAEILKSFEIRSGYEEDTSRGHDTFPDRYAEVLKWLDGAPRTAWPRAVVRVPHEGLFPVSRRVYWMEADSDQATLRAEARYQDLLISVVRSRRIKVWLSDTLVDLEKDFTVTINGRRVFEGKVTRNLKTALETGARDRAGAAAAVLEFDVPLDRASLEAAYKWTSTLAPAVREAKLPWWEHYARATLAERRHRPAMEGEKIPLEQAIALKFPEGLTGVRVTKLDPGSPEARAGLKEGDVLTGFEDEFFYRDGLGMSLLSEWFLRRPENPESCTVSLLRDGKPARLVIPLR